MDSEKTVLTLRLRNIMIVLWCLWAVLVGIHFVFCLDFQPALTYTPSWSDALIERFQIVGEGNIPTLFSAFLFLVIASLAFMIGILEGRQGGKFAVYWKALGWIFLLLMLDEVGCFHEMLFLQMKLARTINGVFYYQWLGPALLFVIILMFVYLKFFLALPGRIQCLFLLAGALFLGGAIGLEMIEGVLTTQATEETLTLSARLAGVEEALELAGQIVFIYALFLKMLMIKPECAVVIHNNRDNT